MKSLSPQHLCQGDGLADLAIRIEQLKAEKEKKRKDADTGVIPLNTALTPDRPIQVAILGRQNVGKSTLVNKLVKSERVLSGPLAGLTRDAIAVDYEWNGKKVQLVCVPRCPLSFSKAKISLTCPGRHCRNKEVHQPS